MKKSSIKDESMFESITVKLIFKIIENNHILNSQMKTQTVKIRFFTYPIFYHIAHLALSPLHFPYY